jgi:hypothetical protein
MHPEQPCSALASNFRFTRALSCSPAEEIGDACSVREPALAGQGSDVILYILHGPDPYNAINELDPHRTTSLKANLAAQFSRQAQTPCPAHVSGQARRKEFNRTPRLFTPRCHQKSSLKLLP